MYFKILVEYLVKHFIWLYVGEGNIKWKVVIGFTLLEIHVTLYLW